MTGRGRWEKICSLPPVFHSSPPICFLLSNMADPQINGAHSPRREHLRVKSQMVGKLRRFVAAIIRVFLWPNITFWNLESTQGHKLRTILYIDPLWPLGFVLETRKLNQHLTHTSTKIFHKKVLDNGCQLINSTAVQESTVRQVSFKWSNSRI